MKRHAPAFAAALFAGVWLAGSAASPAFARSAKKDLTVTFSEKRVQDLSSAGLTINFIFKVANAASSTWYLSGYDYRVVIENTEYFSLRSPLAQPLSIPASSSTLIALPVKITKTNLFQAVPGAEGKNKLSCYLVGGMSFAEEPGEEGDRLSVACSGDFPVYRDLAFGFRPLEVKELTIGGGDLKCVVDLANDNGFPLTVVSLHYALDLGGTRVSEGDLLGLDGLEAKGRKELSVPLLLDFFELGNALYGQLQKPTVPGRISGTVVFDTEWGRFSLPFDASGDVPLSRNPSR